MYGGPRQGALSLQTDPIGYKDDFNLYAYVGNDPLNKFDPDGQAATAVAACLATPCGAAVAAGTVAVAIVAQQAWVNSGIPSGISSAVDKFIHRNDAPHPLPDAPVGEDPKAGRTGKDTKSGPMRPEHGGTGDADKDFNKLTGGKSGPNTESGRPAGTQVGTNGVQIRPGPSGPRIDIPANGSKKPETLHYPPPPPPKS